MTNNQDLNIRLDTLNSMPVGLLVQLHDMVESYKLDRDWTYLTAYVTKVFLI